MRMPQPRMGQQDHHQRVVGPLPPGGWVIAPCHHDDGVQGLRASSQCLWLVVGTFDYVYYCLWSVVGLFHYIYHSVPVVGCVGTKWMVACGYRVSHPSPSNARPSVGAVLAAILTQRRGSMSALRGEEKHNGATWPCTDSSKTSLIACQVLCRQ